MWSCDFSSCWAVHDAAATPNSWPDAAAKAPHKARCWNNLGMANLAARRDLDAVAAFERAVLLDPTDEYASLNLATARALCGGECSRP